MLVSIVDEKFGLGNRSKMTRSGTFTMEVDSRCLFHVLLLNIIYRLGVKPSFKLLFNVPCPSTTQSVSVDFASALIEPWHKSIQPKNQPIFAQF